MTDFQSRASSDGRLAQEMAEQLLAGVGFTVTDRDYRFPSGPVVNFVCEDSNGAHWYFDVSGAMASGRAGLLRTDTVWKTLGRASVLDSSGVKPLVLLTTNYPQPDSTGDKSLRIPRTFFDVAEMTDGPSKSRLRRYAALGWPTHPLPGFWTPDELYGGAVRSGGMAGAVKHVPTAVFGDPFDTGKSRLVTELSHRLKITVPSRDRHGEPIANGLRSRVIGLVKKALVDLGGGCTAQEGSGSWVDPFGGLVSEDVLVVEAYSSQRVPEETLHYIVGLITEKLDQDQAAVIIDDQMLLFDR